MLKQLIKVRKPIITVLSVICLAAYALHCIFFVGEYMMNHVILLPFLLALVYFFFQLVFGAILKRKSVKLKKFFAGFFIIGFTIGFVMQAIFLIRYIPNDPLILAFVSIALISLLTGSAKYIYRKKK